MKSFKQIYQLNETKMPNNPEEVIKLIETALESLKINTEGTNKKQENEYFKAAKYHLGLAAANIRQGLR